VSYAPYGWRFSPLGETITDVGKRVWATYPSGIRRLAYKPVDHEKWAVKMSTSNATVDENTGQWLSTSMGSCLAYYLAGGGDVGVMLRDRCRAGVPTPTSTHYARWERIRPSMASRANLTVFLYELRDLKRMFDILPSKYFRLRDWKSVLKYANDQHLNWNFGWRPFLNDIYKVVTGLSSFESRMSKFLQEASTSLRRRVQDIPQDGSYTSNSTLDGYVWRILETNTITQTVASTFDFEYTIPKFGWSEFLWRSYLDTLGLNVTAANIWRVIPWSFVVDWFVNVGSYLDTYSTDWVQPWIYFCQACSSQKVQFHKRVEVQYSGYAPSSNIRWTCEVKYVRYTRRIGCPTFTWTASVLDADKIRLLASLLLGQIRLT